MLEQKFKSLAWIRLALIAIFFYYSLSAVFLIVWPNLAFDLLGIVRSNHPWLVQLCGILTGLFGFIFLVAAKNAIEFRSIVLIGLLAQLVVPIAVTYWMSTGVLPKAVFWPFVAGDLFWALLLLLVWRRLAQQARGE